MKDGQFVRIVVIITILFMVRRMTSLPDPKEVSKLLRRCRKLMNEKGIKEFSWRIIKRGQLLAIKNRKIVQTTGCKEIDMVVSSGGFRGQYVLGIWSVLRHWRNQVKVVRFAGSSAGAQCGLIMSADLIQNWITFVYPWRTIVKERLYFPNTSRRFQILQLLFLGGIKDLARAATIAVYAPLVGKTSKIVGVHMCCSELSWYGLRNFVISKFSSFEEVVRSLSATGGIPLISSPLQGWTFRGRLLYDGFFTNPLPVFEDKKRPQLVIDLHQLHVEGECSFWSILGPDPDLQQKVIKWGQNDIIRLFKGDSLPMERQNVLQLRWP